MLHVVRYNTWICASLVNLWLMLILKVILHMAHLVMSGEQVIHVDQSTLLYPVKEKKWMEIFLIYLD